MAALSEMIKGDNADRIQAILNMLVEAPYFYKSDAVDDFLFLKRYQREFAEFFESYFGWQLVADAKCARVYKEKWYNEVITPSNRDMFNFTKRDECIAFMALLEFFESKLEEEAISVDDPESYKFRFGDLLEFEKSRFAALFDGASETYSDEDVRKILRAVMPVLEKYRFLAKLPPPRDDEVAADDIIYECLPALWHYNAVQMSRPATSKEVGLEMYGRKLQQVTSY